MRDKDNNDLRNFLLKWHTIIEEEEKKNTLLLKDKKKKETYRDHTNSSNFRFRISY